MKQMKMNQSKVTDILLYSYFYFYWKSKDSFWVISDPNNTVSWLINAWYTITYDADCSIWQYLYLAGIKLFPKVHHSFRWPGFKFQTDHCYYLYDSGQIFPSLWTPVSPCKSKKEWLYFAISEITYNSRILWTFEFKFPKLLVACPSKPTAFEIRFVVCHLFVSCHPLPLIWLSLATLSFTSLFLWNNSGPAQRDFSKWNLHAVGSVVELNWRKSWQFSTGW